MAKVYYPGDVLIGRFRFTDKEDSKVRNFLVITTPKPFIWGVMMSSSESIGQDDGSLYELSSNDLDFKPNKQIGIRMNIIQTVDPKTIEKKLGKVSQDCLERVLHFISQNLNLQS